MRLRTQHEEKFAMHHIAIHDLEMKQELNHADMKRVVGGRRPQRTQGRAREGAVNFTAMVY